jgi:LmbE family N-acetylglucosaminyl deacetylase
VSRESAARNDGLLAQVMAPERPLLPFKTVVIVAHPGDETLACGALLPRFPDICIVHVTDGAAHTVRAAREHGFHHWADYARVRRKELERAAAVGGLPAPALKSLGLPEQSAALRLATLTRALLGFIAGAELVLTHAYEGGDPDHDAIAFAVAAARSRMRGRAPAVIDMPLYRHRNDGDAARLRLTHDERVRKARMLAEFVTQQEVLMAFGVRDECYRIAPEQDFTHPPDDVRYDSVDLGITGGQFAQLARAARGELGLDAVGA